MKVICLCCRFPALFPRERCGYLKEPGGQHPDGRDEGGLRGRGLVVQTDPKVVPDLTANVKRRSNTRNDSAGGRWLSSVGGAAHLGELVPKLIQVREDLGVDLGATDAVDVAQDTQNPSPQHECRVGVPAGQRAACDDADVVRQAFTAVCTATRFVQTACKVNFFFCPFCKFLHSHFF